MNLFGTENMNPSNNSEGSSGKKNNGSKKRRFPTEGSNVFQEYMSRKIELQRQQFGLMVPPAPSQSQTGTETNTGKRRKIDSSGMKSLEEESSSDNENTIKKDKSRNTFGRFDMNEVLSQLEMSQQQQQQVSDPSNTNLERNAEKSSRKDLFFRGVVVLINGKTDPDTPTLMRMLHKHGGDVEKYETSRVTQIIAENISNAKLLNYQKKRKRTPIVHPQWITDSVQAERLLHYQDYLLIEGGQKNMRHFFAKESNNRNNNNIDRNLSTEGQEDLQIPVRNSSEKAMSTISTTTTTRANNNNKSRKTVGNDPNFLESYFNNSRLSFIGSFQQRLKRQNKIQKHDMDKSNSSNATRYVLHVDIDSFFASVVLRNYPQYKNSPVAIGHAATNSHENSSMNARTNTSKSTCELSTCNYIARDFGVKKGMWLHHARSLCPHLIILNYDFDAYEEVSGQVTEILEEYADLYSGAVEQVSCDEAYVELYIINENKREGEQKTDLSKHEHNEVVLQSIISDIRKDIEKKTNGCTASIGCSNNKFLAKMSTNHVKPNDAMVLIRKQEILAFFLGREERADGEKKKNFTTTVKLHDLPGIGRKIYTKLKTNGLETVPDIWNRILFHSTKRTKKLSSKNGQIMEEETQEDQQYDNIFDTATKDITPVEHELAAILGKKRAENLVQYSLGKDPRPIVPENIRKSIGAECNYGVRFDGPYGVDYMISGLAAEVQKRMKLMGVLGGKHLTLKVKQRKENEPKEPIKFNGHGRTNNLSKSHTSVNCISDVKEMVRIALDLYLKEFKQSLGIDKNDIRGMGIVLTKLQFSTDSQNNPDNKGSTTIDITKNSSYTEIAAEANTGLTSWLQDKPHNSSISGQVQLNSEDQPNHKQGQDQRKRVSFAKKNNTHTRKPTSSSSRRGISKQTSVKRMLKLSSLKNRKNNNYVLPANSLYCLNDSSDDGSTKISLTQLDQLPLEMQLQIANNDENDLGTVTHYKKRKPANSNSTTRTKKKRDENVVSKKRNSAKSIIVNRTKKTQKEPTNNVSVTEPNRDINESTSSSLESREITLDHQNGEKPFETSSLTIETNTPEQSEITHSYDHYRDDILPLSNFLDSRPFPDDQDIESMKEFFEIVFKEKRLDDLVSMLRLVKQRHDGWSSSPYRKLLNSVNNLLSTESRRVLDVKWLGL